MIAKLIYLVVFISLLIIDFWYSYKTNLKKAYGAKRADLKQAFICNCFVLIYLFFVLLYYFILKPYYGFDLSEYNFLNFIS